MVRKKQVIIGGICIIGVLSVGMFTTSKIKHGLVENINIESTNYEALKNNMVAMYTSEDGENYTEIEGRMPDSGYVINEEKSYCNLNGTKDDNAILKTVDGNHVIANHFDKKGPTASETILANITVKDTTPDFSQTATADEGVYKVVDGMYGGDSYYWRGAVTNNYVKFAGFCWRIVRINGDGTIRLIYDGTTCHANGANAESIVATNQTYSKDAVYDRSEYVGYTYTEGSQRTLSGTASNLKTQTESWFNTNITGTNASKVADGKFCNDRNTTSGSTWASQPTSTLYYAARERLQTNKTPTLSCPSGDVYTLKSGAITADEVSFAGGVSEINNTSYYLYNGQYCWTMTPYYWVYYDASNRYAMVLYVDAYGKLTNADVAWSNSSIRPVINLLSSTQFKSGTDGTLNNPYEVI